MGNVARQAQLAQFGLALSAITSVTVLCAVGKLDPSTALLVVMGSGGMSVMGSTAVHLADSQTNGNSAPPPEPAAPPVYDPNSRPGPGA
jgi:hypothetical protein